mmetsp:Transcript_47567/g.123176  ORF Transcript_47567/g.123176 Transcript_47567/m.123176 type:complete len:225 (-) Transcript_47567:475-1149(-)
MKGWRTRTSSSLSCCSPFTFFSFVATAFLIDFIAYTLPSTGEFLMRAVNTFPNAPLPTTLSISKSLNLTRGFDAPFARLFESTSTLSFSSFPLFPLSSCRSCISWPSRPFLFFPSSLSGLSPFFSSCFAPLSPLSTTPTSPFSSLAATVVLADTSNSGVRGRCDGDCARVGSFGLPTPTSSSNSDTLHGGSKVTDSTSSCMTSSSLSLSNEDEMDKRGALSRSA